MSNRRSFSLFLFFIILASSTSLENIHKCSQEESRSLLLFKENISSINYSYWSCQNLLGSSYYPLMNNWNTHLDCCDWNGVTCDHFTGDIIGLDLSCGMLQGSIHSNSSLFHLPYLRTLNLAFNNFTGSQLPREIGMLSNTLTHLNISGCGFSGQVSSEISLLHKLVSLDLSMNYDFRLEHHVFINLLRNFTVLEELMLAYVNINSILPTYLNISSSLRFLNLYNTRLQGKLPHYIFNLESMEELDLSENSFTGHIPSEITLLPKLVSLKLSWNKLEIQPHIFIGFLQNCTLRHLGLANVSISLVLPKYLNISSSLESLNLISTGLKGKLPDNIFNLQHLEDLSLSGNDNLTLPKVNMSTKIPLRYLHLSQCGLVGSIPSWLFSLEHLEILDLAWNNNLVGPLPNINMSTNIPLSFLDLSYCGFIGSIPSWFFALQSLEELSFNDNKLSGHIDVLDKGPVLHTFRQLTNLNFLDLSNNNFTGEWELDTLLSSLTKLVGLDISRSGLSVITSDAKRYVNSVLSFLNLASCKVKVFPESLRAMKNLEYLDLSDNEIHGDIPHWAREIGGNSLYYLNISNNFISRLPHFEWNGLGRMYLQFNKIEGPFPLSICNMNKLYDLDMSNNGFGGVIPKCFGNITSSLRIINLRNNHFQGTIPSSYNDCGFLEGFILNGNQFEGDVPSFLCRCQNLKVIDLGNNHLNGTFPRRLGDLPNLRVLVLKSNNFRGPIVSSFSKELPFQSLQVFDLSNNSFVGQLPQGYFQNFKVMKNSVKKSSKLEYLSIGGHYYSIIITVKGVVRDFTQIFVRNTIVDVSVNKFQGEIPNIIGTLNSLKALNLSHNNLNGRIPYSFGSLSEVESLDLSWNQLTGEIPRDLANIKELAVLNLSHNHLIGHIPEGTQFNTFDVSSFGGNLGLCGLPLPKCELLNSQPKGDGYGDDDDESGYEWKMVFLGFGCGTLIGLVLGFLMLSTGKPKWFNEIFNSVENVILSRRKK